MQMWDTRWSESGVDTVKVKAHRDVRSFLNIKQDVIIEYYDFYGKKAKEMDELEKHRGDQEEEKNNKLLPDKCDVTLDNSYKNFPDICPECKKKFQTWLERNELKLSSVIPSSVPSPSLQLTKTPITESSPHKVLQLVAKDPQVSPLFSTAQKTDEPFRSLREITKQVRETSPPTAAPSLNQMDDCESILRMRETSPQTTPPAINQMDEC